MLRQETCLPVLQFQTRNVSSSAAVTIWSPLSSKVIPVICLGPLFVRVADGPGAGGSTTFLKILAGLYLDCGDKVKGPPHVRALQTYHERVGERNGCLHGMAIWLGGHGEGQRSEFKSRVSFSALLDSAFLFLPWATSTRLQSYGKSTGQSTNWSETECVLFRPGHLAPSNTCPLQGFLVSDEEIHMDLQHFRDQYANNSGTVE